MGFATAMAARQGRTATESHIVTEEIVDSLDRRERTERPEYKTELLSR